MVFLKRIAGNEKGTTIIEFAIVAPLLFILLFGTIDFALLLYNKAVITNSSREGARYGIVARTDRYTEAEITVEVLKYCQDRLITFGDIADPTVTAVVKDVNGNGATDFGDNLEINVNWTYAFLAFPDLPGIGFDDEINLSAKTVMKYE